jgi:hypothetical protein
MNHDYPELSGYEYSEIIYLKKFLYLPSSSLYKTLKKFYKPNYAVNERIVCAYQGKIPYDLLAHLQRVIQNLDITNFFVVICNTDNSTLELVDTVHDKYSHQDTTKFQVVNLDIPDDHITADLVDCHPLLNPPETMCMYPWNQFEFKPNGTVRPCCLYSSPINNADGQEFNMNNQTEFTVDDIYFSPSMVTLRQDFRDGKQPVGCGKCWREESLGKRSDRQLYNWVLRDKLFDIDYEAESTENITSLDLKLGNLCNLSCRICNPTLSSTWAVETLNNLPKEDR